MNKSTERKTNNKHKPTKQNKNKNKRQRSVPNRKMFPSESDEIFDSFRTYFSTAVATVTVVKSKANEGITAGVSIWPMVSVCEAEVQHCLVSTLPPYRESTNISLCCYPLIGNPPIFRSVATPLSGIHQYFALLLPPYRESTNISLCCYPFIGNPPILRSVATLSLVRKLWRPLCGLFAQNNDCDVLIG